MVFTRSLKKVTEKVNINKLESWKPTNYVSLVSCPNTIRLKQFPIKCFCKFNKRPFLTMKSNVLNYISSFLSLKIVSTLCQTMGTDKFRRKLLFILLQANLVASYFQVNWQLKNLYSFAPLRANFIYTKQKWN